jgi:hypothetical protein
VASPGQRAPGCRPTSAANTVKEIICPCKLSVEYRLHVVVNFYRHVLKIKKRENDINVFPVIVNMVMNIWVL